MTRPKRWHRAVAGHGDALDLARDVFTRDDPKSLARSLKRSSERSKRRKGIPFQSAMAMLTFYLNRAGKALPEARRGTLEPTKGELRILFHKTYVVRVRRGLASGIRLNQTTQTINMAKGGDPMSHGSAERSVLSVRGMLR